MKKTLSLLLCTALILSGCGSGSSKVTSVPEAEAMPIPEESTSISEEEIMPEAEETASVVVNKPFPQELDFENCIKPQSKTQEQMNDSIIGCYESWKKKFVKESNGNTPGGGYYVEMKGTGGDGSEKTTSEAHGYGMIIFALMAGYDVDAKKYFDGFYNMYDKHRSTINSDLMSWIIHESEDVQKDSDSATDGDMDIAYALLLADTQWGSDGDIDYRKEAQRIIAAIKEGDMSVNTKRSLRGDWDEDENATRPSDWMPDHYRAYYKVTGDEFWLEASGKVYGLIAEITENHSPYTGLMPDFVIEDPPKPAPPNYMEEETDGDYSWNSCRYPWRIATDYAHYGTPEAKEACDKMLVWLKDLTYDDPFNIVAGYTLGGGENADYKDVSFSGPFMAACIVNSDHQEYLNEGWYLLSRINGRYYQDSLALLSMLLISGNWWAPEAING